MMGSWAISKKMASSMTTSSSRLVMINLVWPLRGELEMFWTLARGLVAKFGR